MAKLVKRFFMQLLESGGFHWLKFFGRGKTRGWGWRLRCVESSWVWREDFLSYL